VPETGTLPANGFGRPPPQPTNPATIPINATVHTILFMNMPCQME
jgi:hypothetical protein